MVGRVTPCAPPIVATLSNLSGTLRSRRARSEAPYHHIASRTDAERNQTGPVSLTPLGAPLGAPSGVSPEPQIRGIGARLQRRRASLRRLLQGRAREQQFVNLSMNSWHNAPQEENKPDYRAETGQYAHRRETIQRGILHFDLEDH